MTSSITMRDMLQAGVHFGHRARYWNPKMKPYIFGTRSDIHIINLEKSLPLFQDAVNFLSSVAAKRGKVLFVGTKDVASYVIREEAVRCGMPYVDIRWLGGTLTNYKTMRQSIRRLRELEEVINESRFEGLTKKERLTLNREYTKLERSLGGIKKMGGIPDAVFVIDVGNEKIAIQEANKLGIPVVGIVDTNNSPDNIDYIIPGNDDSLRAIRLYCKQIADVIIDARANLKDEEPEQKAKKEPKKKADAKVKKRVFTKVKDEDSEEDSSPTASNTKAKKADSKPTAHAQADSADKSVEKKPKVVKKPKIEAKD